MKSLHTVLSSQRVRDVQGEIVSELSLKDQVEDCNRKGNEPLTKKIPEYGAKENTAQFNFSNCSIVLNLSK